jgi:membrane fusion protein (multidrug efflux system)
MLDWKRALPGDRARGLAFLASLAWIAASAPVLAQTPPAPAVLVQPAEMRSLARRSDFIGRVEAIEKVDLRARVSGFLGPRRFNDGDAVKADQVLFEIEPESFEAAVAQRQAQLESAKATLDNADVQLQRGRELIKTNAVAQTQLDQRIADQARAAAAVKEAQAGLTDAQIKLSYTKIKSPIAGRVGRPAVTPGNLVGPDSGVLATVVRDDEVNVLFAVSQREILEARRSGGDAGDIKVSLRLADGSTYEETGKIGFLDVSVDAKTDGQVVRATFKNPKRVLTDGQSVRVQLERTSVEQSVAIPQAAVAMDQGGAYVFVVSASNQVEQRRVSTGVQRDGLVAIESGVKAGDLVIVQGQQRARPGQTVTPQRAGK